MVWWFQLQVRRTKFYFFGLWGISSFFGWKMRVLFFECCLSGRVGGWSIERRRGLRLHTVINEFAHIKSGRYPRLPPKTHKEIPKTVKGPEYLLGVCGWDLRITTWPRSLLVRTTCDSLFESHVSSSLYYSLNSTCFRSKYLQMTPHWPDTGLNFHMFRCYLNPSVSKNQHLLVWQRYIRIGKI